MQPALRFNSVVTNVVRMGKISNRSGEGGVVGCAKVPVSEGVHHGSRDILLLGDDSLVLARNCLKSKRAFRRHNTISRPSASHLLE